MKWVYDLCGAEPIIKDVSVYDGTTIAKGEMLMAGLAAAGFYTAGTGHGWASICTANATVGAAQGVNALGISTETKTTADVPSVAALHNLTTGAFCYVKAIVNPSAVYRAWVNTTTTGTAANNYTAAGSSATATDLAQVVMTGLATTGKMNGQWIYFSGTGGANWGQLRKVASSASAATVTLDSACLATFASDYGTYISNVGGCPMAIGADGVNIGNDSVNPDTATNFRVVDNLIDRGAGIELLREHTHAGGKVNLSGPARAALKIYQDIICVDHIYGNA